MRVKMRSGEQVEVIGEFTLNKLPMIDLRVVDQGTNEWMSVGKTYTLIKGEFERNIINDAPSETRH